MITKFKQYESVRDKMTPVSKEDIDDAYEDVAGRISDILVSKYDFDDTYDAYEWAIAHKDIIMEEIDDDPEYDLNDIIYKILYGYEGAMDSH